jgi:aryl-alcohol dehydrogenase-like predicted oxidoreductase
MQSGDRKIAAFFFFHARNLLPSPPQLKTIFGKTGLPATRIGVGMAAMGRPGYMTLGHADDLKRNYAPEAMEQNAHQILDAAWQAGVRYFDTARSYGRAEEFLSSWLKSRPINPNEITVASKWGYTYTAAWQVKAAAHEIKDHSLPVLQRQWQESEALLNGSLHVYQIHSTTLDTGVLDNAGVIAELGKLRANGVAVGLTLTGAEQWKTLRRAMEISPDGRPLFTVVQATWNLMEPSVGPTLSEAQAAGMGIVIKEGLANGRLTDRNHAPEFAEKLAVLRAEAKRLGCTVDALALGAALAQPFAQVVLSGAATTAHLASNLKAAQVQVDAEALERLKALAEPPQQYWQERKALEWN